MSVTHSVVVTPADYTTTPWTPEVREDRTEYVGATLEVGSESVQVMSDIWETARYALVWDDEAKKATKLYWINSADRDATPEVIAAYKNSLVEAEYKKRITTLEQSALIPERGDQVKVVRGRKSLGLEGPVTALTTFRDKFSYSNRNITKVAIPIDDTYEEIQLKRGGTWKKYTNLAWIDINYVVRTTPRPIDYVQIAKDAEEYVSYHYKRVLGA